MNTSNKTVLVTGGGSGIGFAIAQAFASRGNQLILAGRSEDRLKKAVALIPGASYIVSDVTDAASVKHLASTVEEKFGQLDILVNNAGTGRPQSIVASEGIYDSARFEMETNYLSVLRLNELLLPLLKQSPEAAIINIQSIVSYLPSVTLATYSATKAALHSYSLALRLALSVSHPNIHVFEVFPPFVDTDLTKDFDTEKLSPNVVAEDILHAVESDQYAVRNGSTNDFYQFFRQSPEAALMALNQDYLSRQEKTAVLHA